MFACENGAARSLLYPAILTRLTARTRGDQVGRAKSDPRENAPHKADDQAHVRLAHY